MSPAAAPPHPPHPGDPVEPLTPAPAPTEAEQWARHLRLPGLRLRLRVPSLRGDPGAISVAVTIGDPVQVPVDACQILELTFALGAGADAGVVTSADAGTGTLRLVDPERLYDPTVVEGVRIGSVIRVSLGGVPAFRGRIDDISHDLEIATLSLTDGVAELAAVAFVETNVAAESSSARITRILNLAGWPTDRRDIGAGGVSLQAGTVAADAWSELLEVTRNELGALWLTADGKVAWRARAAAWAGGAPVLVFGCPPSDAYLGSLEMRADQSNLVNVLAAARRGGTQAVVTDSASLTKYGRHSHVQNDLELVNDGDRDLWSAFYLTRQSYPALGVAGLSTRPDAPTVAKLLALPLGAIVSVYDEHHGPVISRRARWLGARWTVAPAYVEVNGITGEDASIREVDRSLVLDTGPEFAAYQTGVPVNVTAREPGLQHTFIPKRVAGT